MTCEKEEVSSVCVWMENVVRVARYAGDSYADSVCYKLLATFWGFNRCRMALTQYSKGISRAERERGKVLRGEKCEEGERKYFLSCAFTFTLAMAPELQPQIQTRISFRICTRN